MIVYVDQTRDDRRFASVDILWAWDLARYRACLGDLAALHTDYYVMSYGAWIDQAAGKNADTPVPFCIPFCQPITSLLPCQASH